MSEQRPLSSPLIVVASHRGGCGKSSFAAMLAYVLGGKSGNRRPLLIDFSMAGGSSMLRPSTEDPMPRPWNPKEHEPTVASPHGLPYDCLHAPGAHRVGDAIPTIARWKSSGLWGAIVCDLPVCGPEEVSPLLAITDQVIGIVPCDALGAATLVPFLEGIELERSRPGRTFNVRFIVGNANRPEPEMIAVEGELRRLASSILLRNGYEFDSDTRSRLARRLHPATESIDSPSIQSAWRCVGELLPRQSA